jgi:hypothetical protein
MNSNDWQSSWETTLTCHTPLLNVTKKEFATDSKHPMAVCHRFNITKGIETGPHGE